MEKKKNSKFFIAIIYMSTLIVTIIGSTFAYFSAKTESQENAVSVVAAEYKITLEDDISLIKSQIIPSEEKYVNYAINRLDENGSFRKPYEDSEKNLITDRTVCIDDNLNEICSVYTFTVKNVMTTMELPIQIKIKPTVNTFTNMKYKIVKVVYTEEKGYQTVDLTTAKWLVDDRYEINETTGGYKKDATGYKIAKSNFEELPISNITVEGLEEVIPKATDADNPGATTLSIVMWVEEIKQDQTKQDSGQVFSGGVIIDTVGSNGNGISGVFCAGGVDNE